MSAAFTDNEDSLMEDWPEADGADGDYSPEEFSSAQRGHTAVLPDLMLDTSPWVNVPVIPAHTRASFLTKMLTG